MMWLAMALAAPPEGVDPEDFGRWEDAADKALDGPAGCWELTGQVRIDGALHSPSTAFSRSDTMKLEAVGTWQGRLHDGHWRAFSYRWDTVGEAGDLDVPIYPVIGRIDQDIVVREGAPKKEEPKNGEISVSVGSAGGGAEAINLLQEAIDAWDPTTATSFTQWREADRHIELVQDFPIFETPKSPVVVVTSVFPEGGVGMARLDAVFPRRVKVGEWPVKVTLMDTQFHLRQQQVGATWLPQVEGFTLMAGVLGFTFGYEQQMVYSTAQACVSESL